ncbi:mapk-regulated corepressor-interacting protein 1 isoform X1 [Pteropus vampyrus]|uniref:Mapk-regulated corepressor-interacting protein 1 isoform X1 n=3 Tax=Pteropus TaxID=9401 RepID=A0A6P3QYL4_PTEVA|nr:mapk-regulated corepressor-interacting protein 1 isoform X1 [Pteropus vampyrus]
MRPMPFPSLPPSGEGDTIPPCSRPCLSEAEGIRSTTRGPDTPAMTSSPVSRVVYNGKRNSGPRSPPTSSEIFTPAHEENVRFIYEAWQGVERDLRSQVSGSERGLVQEYVEKAPNPSLKTFKPIDLSDLKRRSTQDAKKS